MFLLNKIDHALITVYGDSPDQQIAGLVSACIPTRDMRVLTPKTPEILLQAAQNSVVTIIGLEKHDDSILHILQALRENRLVSCDIVACGLGDFKMNPMELLSAGFDSYIDVHSAEIKHLRKFLMHKAMTGTRRLTGMILEEEYRRVCDALSSAPASIMIFDSDKRTVFISDHYFRAYPKIAARLVRGLSVYDAFDMMAREEGLTPEHGIYEKLQRFWYNLEGSVEFQLKDIFYRVKAVQLPSRRGTVVMAQNISGYETARYALEQQASKLQAEIEAMSKKLIGLDV
jgi:hypothetical protein